jgi:hydroxyethylthiazole kinase-like uncharacterized protein yjeF
MAQLEQRLFDSGLPVPALMEKAALALAERLHQRLRLQADRTAQRRDLVWPAESGVLVLVGPGHNGGDGLVVARELHLGGLPVRIWSPFERHKPLTADHLRHALWLGIPRLEEPPDPNDPALWLDALFGIGQRRPPGEPIEQLLEQRQRQRPGALVAVDGPTGLCADSGRLLGWGGATAALTWSIGLLKRGFQQDRALARVGQLERIDLGLPPALLAELPPTTPLCLRPDDAATAPWPALDPAAAKYGRGRLLLVAGSCRYRGAAALCLAGASASGCGSLRAALPEELAGDLWLSQPHVVLEAALPSGVGGGLDLASLAQLDLARLDALLLGPGLGPSEEPGQAGARAAAGDSGEEEVVWQRLQRFVGLLLLDADGLNRLAWRCRSDGMGAAGWLSGRCGPTWITPHRGEFDRLFPQWSEREPLEAAAAAAAASGAVVLLKGARSVVAAPDGRLWQVSQAAPESARAGLGDTLAGYAAGRGAMALAALGGLRPNRERETRPAGQGPAVIAALDRPGTQDVKQAVAADALASRSGPPLDAALLAAVALEHAQAGCDCRRRHGPGGVTPEAVAVALAARG